MFVITLRGIDRIYYNQKSDDFLRYLPDSLVCNIDDMVIRAFSDADEKALKIARIDSNGANTELFIEDGKLRLKNLETDEVLCEMTPVEINWPYTNRASGEKAGDFLGIKLA